MGLAPYGTPRYRDKILSELVDLKEDGSLRLNLSYFDFMGGMRMTNRRFEKLFNGPRRKPETNITQREMDIAASIQQVTEAAVMRMVKHLHKETGFENLCLGGGVALNCVSNGLILSKGPFKSLWIQPAAGDAGGALGAALSVWYRYCQKPRSVSAGEDRQNGSYLGPAFSNSEVKDFLERNGYPYHGLEPQERACRIAEFISEGKIVGYMTGPMEFGPRALGARSILGDPRSLETQSIINLKIKYRESFRPFAPSVLEDKAPLFFEIGTPSPYMLLVASVKSERCIKQDLNSDLSMLDRLKTRRSDIPAVTHLDYSARVQTVNKKTKPDYYDIISAFEKITGYAVIVNTSFNVRGEPIVCNPEDAYRCFMRTEMDVLVMENCILYKNEQPHFQAKRDWRGEFELD
jgi:carbamoyltransferase